MFVLLQIKIFLKYQGAKFIYARNSIGNSPFIRMHDLLLEQGINDVEIYIQDWDEIPCFFPTSKNCFLPFDVFAASFYLLSRYEEYLPHLKDEHGRYPASESLAFKNGFLEFPVVDIWIHKLKTILLKLFPEVVFPSRIFEKQLLMDVSASYEFKEKDVLRTIGATLLDLSKLHIGRVFERFSVLFGIQRDAYDNFDELLQFQKDQKWKTIYFFLFADYSTYDKNSSVNSKRFKELIKKIADYTIVSLMASYETHNDLANLKKERKRLINVINRPVKRVRVRFNRIQIPETYRNLTDAEFNEDYTMGYTNYVGFRAGTCTPFYFYDVGYEVQLPILVNSFCLQDKAFQHYSNKKVILRKVQSMHAAVEAVNGRFLMVFSNEIIGGKSYVDWKTLYKEIVNL